MTWHYDAACRGMDTEVFFDMATNVANINAAKAICQSCPVQSACLQAALDEEAWHRSQERYGIRGGLTHIERGAYAFQRKRHALRPEAHELILDPDDPRHGKQAGYHAHRKMGEKPCPDCREAYRIAQVEYRAAKRDAQDSPIAYPDDPRHGSLSGWHAHISNGIPTCDDCKRARREYVRALRERTRTS